MYLYVSYRGQKKVLDPLELELQRDGCEPLYGFWESNPTSWEVLFPAESTLQPYKNNSLTRCRTKHCISVLNTFSFFS